MESGAELQASLRRILEAALELFHVSGLGLMVLDEGHVLRYIAATDQASRALEHAQARLGYGPCVESLVHDRVVVSDDLGADERWPGLGMLVTPLGVRAVLGVPVHLSSIPVGSLNAYLPEPHRWDESEVRALEAYSALLDSVLAHAVHAHRQDEIVRQLQHALDSRVVIDRAVGYIMGRDGVDEITAFNRLRASARDAREKVAVTARRLLSTEADLQR